MAVLRRTAAAKAHWDQGIRPNLLSALAHLEPVFAPAIEAAGFRLVRLRLIGGATKTLQVMAERPDGTMDVEGCAQLSHALSEFIEKENPIEGDFELEVSSPGIDRPLTRIEDFVRWSGHAARIDLVTPIDDRKRLRGTLLGLDGNNVIIEIQGSTRHVFPFSNVAEAKLILTDKLIAENFKARKARD